MNRRLVGALALLVCLGGCATPPGKVNPTLFGRTPAVAESPVQGRVALLAQPQVRFVGGMGDWLSAAEAHAILPVGHIAEQAMLLALNDAVRGGGNQVDAMPLAGSGFSATLAIDLVRMEHRSRLLWMIPIPYPPFLIGDSEITSQLSIDISLLDNLGRTVWTRTYDSGALLWKRPSFWSMETSDEGLTRMAHESAWRLSREAVRDLREWLVERGRPRAL